MPDRRNPFKASKDRGFFTDVLRERRQQHEILNRLVPGKACISGPEDASPVIIELTFLNCISPFKLEQRCIVGPEANISPVAKIRLQALFENVKYSGKRDHDYGEASPL